MSKCYLYFRGFSALLLLLLSQIAAAQQQKQPPSVQLRDHSVVMQGDVQRWADSASAAVPKESVVEALLSFDQLPDPAQRDRLRATGIELQEYIPPRSFMAYVLPSVARSHINAAGILGIAAVQPGWKLDARLLRSPFDLQSAARTEVMVSFSAATTEEQVGKIARSLGGEITDKRLQRAGIYILSMPQQALKNLAARREVRTVAPQTQDQPLNLEEKGASYGARFEQPVSAGGLGLNGKDIVIGIGDNSPSLFHIDTKDRTTNFSTATPAGHGQHVAGTAAGTGIINPRARGMAPAATMLNHFFNLIWINQPTLFPDYNMTLTNNSYAAVVNDCSFAGVYEAAAQALDKYASEFPLVQNVFSAGNDGGLTCPPYPQGYATVVGSYQAAKNVLTVGLCNSYFGPRFTSQGPVKDGRLKPEITTIGVGVFSTVLNDTYTPVNGTSMASPSATGGLALLTQRYKETHAGAYPQNYLLKGLLLAGATDIGRRGPDFQYGFGFMNLDHSIRMMDSNRYQMAAIGNGGQQTHNISIPANTAMLKVMLYWNDTAASPFAATTLVNDLDLEVTEPNSTNHLPLILNPAAGNVLDTAVEGVDRRNNAEQIVIRNPGAGTYVATVKGFNVPYPNQKYVLLYDIVPAGVKLIYPTAGHPVMANDSVMIFWEAALNTNTFTVEFSTNNGGSWTILDAAVAADRRSYKWQVDPLISSEQCLVRVTRNGTGEQSVSGLFSVNLRPNLQLAATQCPGYIAMHWSPVANATGYEILRKIGYDLVEVDTVADTNYVFKGLSLDSLYYVAVRPLINGVRGYRSLAINRQPNTGTCTGNISDNDMMVESVESPGTGRVLTSTDLTAVTTLGVRVRNLDDAPVNSYTVHYRINAGAWQSFPVATPLAANSSTVVSIPGQNFAAVGTYVIRTAVVNNAASDPVTTNDSLVRTIRQLSNPALTLATPFTDDFEASGNFTVQRDSMGFTPNEHWDFSNGTNLGRLRPFVVSDVTIAGSRSLSMDAEYTNAGNQNFLYGTFNLGGLDTATSEVRMEFDYNVHGRPKFATGNQVWARGNDAAPWQPLYQYDTTSFGQVKNSGSLSVSDALRQGGTNFSSSFQVRFGQNDTSVITMKDFGNGVTIDDVRLYTVANDAQLLAVISPVAASCNGGGAVPVTVRVANGVIQTLNNIQLFYTVDGGPVQTGAITTLPGKDTVDFTFGTSLPALSTGVHTLDVWLSVGGDTYLLNDSLLDFSFRNQPLIASFPHLENFEANDGFWYSGGNNSSWGYGTPASIQIDKAASGTKAWKTGVGSNYNDLENSYLYSPCYDISGLTSPMLSFSMAQDIENCGSVLCDGAHMEYSYDGLSWTKLGASGQGTNWYNNPGFQVWNLQNDTRWKVASIPLPASAQPIRLRFVFHSDPGASREGLAIDDIHIYNLDKAIYNGSTVGPVTNTVNSGSGWVNFESSGQILAQINPGTHNLGSTDVNMYAHANIVNQSSTSPQYFLPRSFRVNSASVPADSITARLYILDSEVLTMLNATSCPSCSKPDDAYELGITKYDDPNPAFENGSLADNGGGIYTYYPFTKIRWVPYDQGYYAEVKLPSFSELWFNDGGPTNSFPLPLGPLNFDARKINNREVRISWTSLIDTYVIRYEVQRSTDAADFNTIRTVIPINQVPASYVLNDTPSVNMGGTIYYRLRYISQNGDVNYSPVRRVDWTKENQLLAVYPNPSIGGAFTISWSAFPGTDMEFQVTDQLGKLVSAQKVTATEWNNRTDVSLPQVAGGMYFLRAIIGNEQFDEKLIIVK